LKHLKDIDIYDILILAGGLLAAFGVWQIYQPAAYIAAGLALVWLGLPRRRK